MAGFVARTLSRDDAIKKLFSLYGFPWSFPVSKRIPIEDAIGSVVGESLTANSPSPPFSRSLRDGYAVISEDILGASETSPVFLKISGEVPMGSLPGISVTKGNAALVHTGGAIPAGSDAVIMIEDTANSGSVIEIRKNVQVGENILFRGEEFESGQNILSIGSILDFKNIGSLSACGFERVGLMDIKIAIISTGDEIVPPGIEELQPGMIRDSNSFVIKAHLARAGFKGDILGIIGDDPDELRSAFFSALDTHDVVLLSGGSSVSIRDHSLSLLKSLGGHEDLELPVRGLNISPGKPTIVSGDPVKKKLAVCLPGHPHSCSVICATFLVPLLRTVTTGRPEDLFCKVFLPAASDIFGKSGVEEFIPVRLSGRGEADPLWGRSGYVLSLNSSDGFIRLSESAETVRKGEDVEVWLW